jgi:hypothetical protein
MFKLLPLVALIALLGGCATGNSIVLDANHPANPNAPAAPSAVPSTTLALTPAPAAPTPATAPATTHQHERAHPAAQETYVCPMHPDVVSDKPGTCPKCGMRLVRKEAGK